MPSYDRINTQTVAEIIAASPNGREIAWAELVLRRGCEYSMLFDNMVGKPGSGKPFIRRDDLKVKAGREIVIPLVGGTRGPGVQGAGDRIGSEKKLVPRDFSFSIGRWWDGFAIDSVAKEETIIGSRWDKTASDMLQKNLASKLTDDMLMELVVSADASNTVRPNNKATRSALRSADVFGTATVTRSKSVLVSLGATPASLGKAGPDQPAVKRFLHLGAHLGLESYKNSQSYLDAAQNADVRGQMNALFTGNIFPWMGNPVYEWDLKDPDDIAPAGCPLVPRAFLGEQIAGAAATPTIKGGANAAGAADTTVKYFGFFSNAAYVGAEGTKRAADTTTERYIGIQVLTGADAGKMAYFSYKVNSGNTLTGFKRLGAAASGDVVTSMGSGIAWGSGTLGGVTLLPSGSAIPVGSLIHEVTDCGIPFNYQLGLGEMAGVFGWGSINGDKAMGKRTEEHRNHDMDHAIGIETVFGTKAFQGLDGKPHGYTLVESALQLPGWPVIA
jgi:hypothetical protein